MFIIEVFLKETNILFIKSTILFHRKRENYVHFRQRVKSILGTQEELLADRLLHVTQF